MRTDQPWLEIVQNARQALTAKPQPLVEEEVAPGRILFGPGRRQWLAILGAAFGLAGAAATLGSTAHRGANSAALGETTHRPCWYLEDILSGECGDGSPVEDIGGREMFAVLPTGRRLDPTQ